MPGQLSQCLCRFYGNARAEARAFVEMHLGVEDINQEDEEVPDGVQSLEGNTYEFWKVNVPGEMDSYEFVLAVPWNFPDRFPRIYLSYKDYQRLPLLPHVGSDRFVCTRDPNVCVLNDKKPGEAVICLLEIAVEIIEAGRREANYSEFITEFLAYWGTSNRCTVLNLFQPDETVQKLSLVPIEGRLFGAQEFLVHGLDTLRHWLRPFDVSADSAAAEDVLYLPLESVPSPSIKTNEDILSLIERLPETHQRAAKQFQGKIIVCSFPSAESRVLFAWAHKESRTPGFRPGRPVPLVLRLTNSKNKTIKKCHAKRLDSSRLFRRTAGMKPSGLSDKSVALFGCGSVGSHLALDMVKSGIQDVAVVDNEILSAENVPRHLCTMVDAASSPNKAEIVAERLRQHCPDVCCTAYCSGVLELLRAGNLELSDHNMVVSALGSYAVERRLDYVMREREIDCPIAYLWVEPLGVGGHILYVMPNDDVFQRCFDEKGRFLRSIAKNPDDFTRQEAGCQTSFLPYGHTELRVFSSMAAKTLLGILEGDTEESMLFSWIGDVATFEEAGYNLNSAVSACPSHTLLKRAL